MMAKSDSKYCRHQSDFEKPANRFNTVFAFYHDAYSQWQVKVDPCRSVEGDCRYEGWGYILDEAVKDLEQNIRNIINTQKG